MRDNAIKVLASNCPNLSTLVIANCPFITDASLLAIATGLSNVRYAKFNFISHAVISYKFNRNFLII